MNGFEQAREALDAHISGADKGSSEVEPSANNQQQTQSTQDSPSGSEQATKDAVQQAMVELDKLEKFKYKGKEWTSKDLEAAMLRQSDYTKKTQEIAQERRFADNLGYDLLSVYRNPSLASQFKQVYPEKYHKILEEFLGGTSTNAQDQASQQTQQANQYATLDPSLVKEFNSLKGIVQELQSGWQKTEAEKTEAQLTSLFQDMEKKYPGADQRTVLATGQALSADGHKLTAENWERIFKQEHDRFESMFKARREKEVKEQLEANKKGRDVGASGGIPGQAPRKISGFKEATEAALAALSGKPN